MFVLVLQSAPAHAVCIANALFIVTVSGSVWPVKKIIWISGSFDEFLGAAAQRSHERDNLHVMHVHIFDFLNEVLGYTPAARRGYFACRARGQKCS